ncbi:MAG: phage major capsid protein [Actinomycetia bacterium]|nr:phage major capsid protein [Actinomycetes bacterium]
MSDDTEEARTAGPTLTHSQSIKRLEEIYARMEELGEADDLTDEEDNEFSELRSEFAEIDEHRKRLERAAELASVRTAAAGVKSSRKLRLERGSNSQGSRDDYDRDSILEPDSVEECRFRNPWDLSEVRTFGRGQGEVAGELRSRALSAIEKMSGCSDNVRQAATNIIERFDDERGSLAKQCLATSSPAYLRAWSKLAKNHGDSLTEDEKRAIESVRAMSLTDSAGGYLVPFQLDPTVIITSSGSRNDIRQFARQVVATGDVWNGVSSGAVTWTFAAEGAEVADGATTFAQPSVTTRKAHGFVPISIEALEDEANVTSEVAKLLAFGKDQLESTVFISGAAGSNQPVGLITALDGSSAEINPATAEVFALADVYGTQGALPARFRGNASWLANNLTYNTIRNFDSAGGSALWERIGADRPALLLGRPAGEAEAMNSTADIDAGATEDNFLLVFGDFDHYVIADRVGMSVEFIPHLFHTGNNRPSGQRGWYAYYRVGAGVTNSGAFKVMNVVTAA